MDDEEIMEPTPLQMYGQMQVSNQTFYCENNADPERTESEVLPLGTQLEEPLGTEANSENDEDEAAEIVLEDHTLESHVSDLSTVET